MDRKGSGIKIYRESRRGNTGRKDRLSEVFLFSIVVSSLAAAWMNAFLSVFTLEADRRWLYGSLVILTFGLTFLICRAGSWTVFPAFLAAGIFLWSSREAVESLFVQSYGRDPALSGASAAVLAVPVLALWIFVIRSGRGKTAAGAAAAAPFIVSACAGYFPPYGDSWMLLFAGVMYFASGALGKMSVLKKMAALAIAAGSFALLAGISAFAGRYLDAGREVGGSFYQVTRETIRTDLIGGIERLVRGAEEEDIREMEADASSEADETAGENTVAPEGEEAPGAEIFGDTPAASEGSMDHLKEISSYQPDPGAYSSIVVVTERPTDTVYVHSRTGITYTGGSWERGEYPGAVLADETEYIAYPSDLDRLEEMCRYWDRSSVQAVGRQIDEVFSAMAVYDTNPGSTPADKDFAEYFLFDNHKGFCVHFATTAALLYRMCGYPSVYIEGYAVPASAFEQMENGSYRARIDGSMGHAWCRVYDEREGWENREHTPANPDRTEAMPEEDEQAEEQAEGQTENLAEADRPGAADFGMETAAAAVFLMLFLAGIFLLQAAVRRKRRRDEMAYTAEENGIPAMYDMIIKTAETASAGRCRKDSGDSNGRRFMWRSAGRSVRGVTDDLGEERLEALKAIYTQISKEEWDWFYERVMQSLFYETDPGREEWKRACRLCRRFSEAAGAQMGMEKRLLCRYVYCINVFPQIEEKRERKGE